MSADNAFIGRNYFEGDVRMPVPPEYFLQRIYDYDVLLVMFASMARPGGYVLARRREHSAGLTAEATAGIGNPDTRLCMAMGWVPICMFYQTGVSWNPEQIVARLSARDIRAQGGADAVADRLEAEEDAEKAAQKKATRDEQWDRSGEAWRSYQARTGASSIQFHGEVKTPVKETTDTTVSTPRSTAGLDATPGVTIGGEV